MIEVRQEDRDRAAELCAAEDGEINSWARRMRSGKLDGSFAVQAFAAHRQQSEAAMRERCAKVAEDWCVSKAAQGMKDTTASAIRIAAAIRGIDAGGEGER